MSDLPPIRDSNALFLDFDGTLADIAPQPDAVRMAPELVATLAALSARLDGALAIVSGRPVSDLDRFLAPLRPPLAAEHGAVLRFADGSVVRRPPPDLRHVQQVAGALASEHPGLLFERKSAAIALHYRGAPHLGTLCLDMLAHAVAADPDLAILHGKYVVEVKPAAVDKGKAIASLMADEPFGGRLPLFAGDDVTDEAGFACVQAMGGSGIKVGDGETLAMHRCGAPDDVREWLESALSERLAVR